MNRVPPEIDALFHVDHSRWLREATEFLEAQERASATVTKSDARASAPVSMKMLRAVALALTDATAKRLKAQDDRIRTLEERIAALEESNKGLRRVA